MKCNANDPGKSRRNVCHKENINECRDGREIEDTVAVETHNQNALIPRTRLTSLVNLKESRTGRRSSSASSDGSEYHPSIGIPFAKHARWQGENRKIQWGD
jgi:hypothetical protein